MFIAILLLRCCIRQDGTRFDSECAFIYSDIMVNISQVTPVTIQNKNHLEIIQITQFNTRNE